MIYVCREFGWDYHTYMAQPIWFIEHVVQFLDRESKELEAENRRMKNRYGN